MRTGRDVEALLAGAELFLVGWKRIFDLGPLPLIRAVIAKPCAQP
jgi:hypothetical protein